MRRASIVVARKVGVEVNSALCRSPLPSAQVAAHHKAVIARRIRVPDIHLRALHGQTSLDVDDLHGEAEVNATLTGANILAERLALFPVRAVDRLLGQGDAFVLVKSLVPAEVGDVLGVLRVAWG